MEKVVISSLVLKEKAQIFFLVLYLGMEAGSIKYKYNKQI